MAYRSTLWCSFEGGGSKTSQACDITSSVVLWMPKASKGADKVAVYMAPRSPRLGFKRAKLGFLMDGCKSF
jgi:hypothetical protein